MNRHVNAIAGRLSLRAPQRRSLEILDRLTEIIPPSKGADIAAALEIIHSEFPSVTDFEREFPSLCFALATGVGKTRLMGAFISYLHLAHGINNFFVLAPNLTIYNKLIVDFSDRTHPKYVFKGISEFAIDAPSIITGDNYDQRDPASGTLFGGVRINIFNISKINSEVRGGKSPRIKRLSEYIGESYFDYLAGLPDLVLLMDESHRYRASAGIKAINELKPILGLELTATPFVESARGAVPFKNVILDYPLGKAMEDGFVKEPAVVTRKNFNPAGMSTEEIERMKLEDGVRLHESVKVELETYARETDNKIVKPFLLVIARDTTHAGQLLALIQSNEFFEGRYKDKVIQVDSSRTGAEEEEMIARLLKVEHTEEPTEIVIHVNMLKEGWDVTNLYTIVPLRAANARILIEQSIGRGLRLPYGKRTGVIAVDRLNIIAHDKFQEIINEANRPDSAIHLKTLVLDNDDFGQKTATIVSQSQLATQLGIKPADTTASTKVAGQDVKPVFTKLEDQKVAQIAYEVIRKLENQPTTVPSLAHLKNPETQAAIVKAVQEQHRPTQMELEGVTEQPDFAAVVAKTVDLVMQQTIDIPRILVVPKGEVKAGFKPFTLKLDALKYPAVSEDLWIQHLRTSQLEVVTMGNGGIEEKRLEDYVVSSLVDFDDVSYDDQADLLYDLATQTVKHFCNYLSEDDARKVLRCYQRDIGRFIHVQMQEHSWEDAVDYEVVVSKGYTEFKSSAYTYLVSEPTADYKVSPADKSNMSKYVFGGFKRCLYPVQKFDSEAERVLSVILDRDAGKWFKPAKGQFQIFYKQGANLLEYQPDFVAETDDAIYMLEPKASNQMEDAIVLAKKEAAMKWCKNASDYSATNGGKRWRYVLIPHTSIAANMTLDGLAGQFGS
ncbi:MAG: type III restriction endonuclease subunit R [Gallionellales bacterium 35-53-114]|jgi:type III restriction enzyme|nr:MAG: type III restriction endonuclease subunit R [Gallionellales bacterium 35-53-114]OYZ64879.1 MAG: type III restriction endonuclease subunit R [Gallionellales bacterium 24-53-125]OZB07583.1 MAG: type III restriction endonuclease subunit R [Gallionellales bacterium 39-52-133]HQS58736.1 DEAD/DEAH box helicase family protein [Gallionellaceae bacterium]HQS75076.1 DEAD/DEAH box helicase family protein [Gallionellaceae bacterium]